MSRIYAALLAAALASVILPPAAVLAQVNTSQQERSFDYNPDEASTPKLEQPTVETTFDDAEMIEHPVYGTIIVSKTRWKNWVARALYLTLANIALLAIILSMPKSEEHSIVISYALSGASFTVSLWVCLCAMLLMKLKAAAWLYVMPAGLIMVAVSYAVLMKIKRSDVSLTELKESFKKLTAVTQEDQRLSSVDGSPGDWPDQDFVR